MQGHFQFLGTGGSMGVPVIGCSCSVCLSTNPHNQRLRSAGLIKINGKVLLIDAGPDFRQQALTHQIDQLDGVLLTHPHFDHVGGVDDLRAYYFKNNAKLPCLLSNVTMQDLKHRYHYMMRPLEDGKSVSAQIDFQLLEHDFGKVVFQGIPIHYMTYSQAGTQVNGFKIGNLAYISDIREYSDDLVLPLKGIDILILSALRLTPTLMHFSVEEAIDFAKSVGAKKTYLTHIAHDLEHDETAALLPPNVLMGYDGLTIGFELDLT